jgi:hypothetical protein
MMNISRNLCFTVALAFIGASLAVHARQQNDPPLKVILDRAQKYAAVYERALGTIIAEEDYVQDAEWEPRRVAPRAARAHRQMYSDFLLTRVGTTWIGVRNVKQVDGHDVEAAPPTDFAKVLSNSPSDIALQLKAILLDNARYNIGDLARTINVPTFPLAILQPGDFHRFSFEKGLEVTVDGVTTREVRFTETSHPTLVRGLNGENEESHGRLWIEPDSGRIRRTETIIEGKAKNKEESFVATITVTYSANPKLAMLVPSTLHEQYKTMYHSIDCLAKYSNFRRFEVDVKFSEPGAR